MFVLAGCYSTSGIQKLATTMASEIGALQSQQSQRIEAMNAQYDDTFASLMEQLRQEFNIQLSQEMELDSRSLSDNLMSNWQTATLPGNFSQALINNVNIEFQRIQAADQTVADARSQYTKAYQSSKVTLQLLDKAKSDLVTLSQPGNMQDATNVAVEIAQAINTARQQQQTTPNSANQGSPPGK